MDSLYGTIVVYFGKLKSKHATVNGVPTYLPPYAYTKARA